MPRAGRKQRQARRSPQPVPAAARLRAISSLPQLLRGARPPRKAPGVSFRQHPPRRARLFHSRGVPGFCGQGTGFERATRERDRVREAFTPLFLKCAGCPGIRGVAPAGALSRRICPAVEASQGREAPTPPPALRSPRRSFPSGDTSCTLCYSFLLSQKGLSPCLMSNAF